jgi:virginiamycin B lyase
MRFAGLVRNRDRAERDAGASPRRGWARKPMVEGLERRRVLSLAAPPPIDEFPVPTPAGAPTGIVTGPDGAIWFTEAGANQIGRISTSGVITEFPVTTAGGAPTAITAGPDGALWFTEIRGNQIGRINTGGRVEEFPVPTAGSGPDTIVAGPDGALWFTEYHKNQIGRITTLGVVTEFPLPAPSNGPLGITAGSDGALWFTELSTNRIGRITTAGAVSELPIPSGNGPYGIAAGPDGALWYTETFANTIGRVAVPLTAVGTGPTPTEGSPFSGVVATFAYPDPAATPTDFAATIVWGDGNITPGQVSRDAVGDFVVSGQHTYAHGGQGYPVSVAVLDPDSRTIIATATANVAAAPLEAAGAPITAVEGAAVPAGITLATFTDTGGADPLSAYAATVAWGDGTTDPAIVMPSGAGFQVVATVPHTYADEGTYTALVRITEANAAGAVINTASASDAVTVADATLVPSPVLPFATTKGSPFVGAPVAAFTDANSTTGPGDFTAMIDWGDGTTASLGVVF